MLAGNLTSVRTDALSRYVKFVAGLWSSPSKEVSVMCGVVARDVRTTTGLNLRLVKMETGMDPLNTSAVKVKAVLGNKLVTIPDMDRWRLGYMAKLLEERGQTYYEGGETEHLTVLIDSLSTS